MRIDLLAPNAIELGINIKNNEQLTPLAIACRMCHTKVINIFFNMNADPKISDSNEHDSLWHLYHPDTSVLAHRRPFCSEHKQLHEDRQNFSTEEVAIVKNMIKLGCSLFSETNITQRINDQLDILHRKHGKSHVIDHKVDNSLEAGDVVIFEDCFTLFKSMLHALSQLDCWRLCKPYHEYN